jgi:signal transduction histidine kinase
MNSSPPLPHEERILVLAPTARDATLCKTILSEAGMNCVVCGTLAEVCAEIEAGAGAAVLTEESLNGGETNCLAEALHRQPAWSDFPILMLTCEGANSEIARRTLATLGNVTLLERPVRVPSFVSAARSALRARRRQYQIQVYLAEKESVAHTLMSEARRKDEFLAMLAHELRNPLAPIMNALELFTPEAQCESTDWAVRLMKRQVEHIVRLVDDLMDISRVMRGKIRLRLEPVEVSSAVHHAVEEARPALQAQQQQFVLTLPADSLWVLADPNRLSQVISNLLTNAAKYTNRGGVVSLSVERDENAVLVSVRDTGIGIASEMLDRIFEPFAQVVESVDRSRGGLGIGLALVKTLVEVLGGQVEAFSEGLGKGSLFRVRLPLIEHKVHEPVRDWRPASMPSRRVLVVDDNQEAAVTLASMLSKFWGHQVEVAHDGYGAVAKAEQFHPDVALLDIGLPGLSGYEVAVRMRETPELASTLLVALTGYGQDQDRQKSMEAGFDVHLIKPASIMTLEDVFFHPKLNHV